MIEILSHPITINYGYILFLCGIWFVSGIVIGIYFYD